MDAMWKPSKFDRVYPFSTAFTFFVTVPHSVLSVLAFGKANIKQCALLCAAYAAWHINHKWQCSLPTVKHALCTGLTSRVHAANVYGVLPAGGWRTSSIVLMLFHQCVGAHGPRSAGLAQAVTN